MRLGVVVSAALALLGTAAAQAPEPRHELRIGVDTDRFNYTDTAAAESVRLTSKWNSRWTTAFTTTSYQRFAMDAQRFTAMVSRKMGNRSWISVVGGAGHDEGVIPRREAALEFGHAIPLSRKGLVRGVEFAVSPQWLWFAGTKVLVLSETGLLYLPRDWTLTVTIAEARTSSGVPDIQWRPAGNARLNFPIGSDRLRGSLSFGAGTENFTKADELGHFSARTFGGGVRYRLSARQEITVTVAYQDRSQARTQTSVGVGYAVRF